MDEHLCINCHILGVCTYYKDSLSDKREKRGGEKFTSICKAEDFVTDLETRVL